MGVVFTAEFLSEVGDPSRFASADALAAAARSRDAPVGHVELPAAGSEGQPHARALLYMSSLSCTVHHAPSRAYYQRKRAEGKAHRQAVVALARQRVNVLWAMLRDGQPYRERSEAAA